MENKEDFKFYNIVINILISCAVYLSYLELNPKITGIWLRRDSSNRYRLSLGGLKDFILFPFKNYRMWYPSMWDMNIFISIPTISYVISFF